MSTDLRTARAWLERADRILIAAGAGLSAAAGYDYTDEERFAELFPAHHRRGLRARYQLIGLPLPPSLLWGYWAVHIDDIRFGPRPNPTYQRLRDIVGETDHFVMTSNVDGLFARNGFDPDRIWTPQGDYGLLQCETPCSRQTWPSRPSIQAALEAYDPASGQIASPEAIPICPRCGGAVFPNVRKGHEFIDDPYVGGLSRLTDWLDGVDSGDSMLVLDIGTGYNTPGVIRWPAEHIAYHHPNASFIRINRDNSETPHELASRSIGLAADAGHVLDRLSAIPRRLPTQQQMPAD